jgi:hypothetical protein
MMSVETVPRIRGGGMNSGGGEFKYHTFDTV